MSVATLERQISGFERLQLNPRVDALEDRFTNASGALRSAGDVVILSTTTDTAFTTTTSADSPLAIGVLRQDIGASDRGLVATHGQVDRVAVTAATRGQYLSTSTTAGKAVGSASPTAGTFGICLQDAVGGFCPALVFPFFNRLIAAGLYAPGSIVNADVNASAEIAVSKLADGAADDVLLTNVDGVTVNWGKLANANVSASAAIVDTKLAVISTADAVSLSAVNIDGAAEMGAAIADADVIPIDDGGAGTNRKALVTRIYEYVFSKVSGDVSINSSGVSTIGSGVIVNADVSATAEIAVSKLADGDALALLRTDAAGTGVEWGSAGQIAFPASQNASADANTLDDYEEGTWTPALGGSTTYSTLIGRYTKIGRHVTIILRVAVNAAGTGSTSTFGGLPFATATLGSTVAVGFWANLALAPVYLAFYINGTTLIAAGATAANATLTSGLAIFGNGAEVNGSGVYEV